MQAITTRLWIPLTVAAGLVMLFGPGPQAAAQSGQPDDPAEQPADIEIADTEPIPLPPPDLDQLPTDPDMVLELVDKYPELSAEFMPLLLPGGADRPAEWSCIGCHDEQVDRAAWLSSVHKARSVSCLHCHPEAVDVPHEEPVDGTHCGRCHRESNTIMASAEASAHGPHGPGAENGCGGCHDPHTMGESGADAAQMATAGCLECHDVAEDLADKHSKFLCAADLHLAKVGCQYCHISGDDSEAVHNVKFGEAANVACEDCHGADSVLALAGPLDGEETDESVGILEVNNNELIRETGYLIGANRIIGLDILMILLVLGACCFPVFHGGLRIIFRRAQ